MTQITFPSISKYDNALYFTLLVMVDDRMSALETENVRLLQLSSDYHQSRLRYDTAYKQSTKSFLTETIAQKDTARDKVTKVIEWVARYWMELPDEEDAVRGRRIYQPFKDFEYRRDEALLAQNGKWQNIRQVLAAEPQAGDLQAMGLTALVAKANTLTSEIANLMVQRQTEGASYQVGEMKAARVENETLFQQMMQYMNALLIINPDAALEQTAQYIQQDLNKVEQQYQQSRRHKKGDDPKPEPDPEDGGSDEGGEVTPVKPE